jgi:branched-chain amino acid aminotransferase
MANIEVSGYRGENNWALLLDPDGFVAEGTGDNFFIVKDGIVITPEGRNILRGISREYVMNELCPKLKLKCIEKNIEAYDVYTADEAFMTGTPFCMLPVTSLNGNRIGNGSPGRIFGQLLSRWGKNVGIDIKVQIKSWESDNDPKGPTPYQFKG